ncbi:T6SS effector BTH_I2691 family protein [Comamonas sp. GB3 AK4-5]|uniref:T6SS effector BTH_I2691 family protein n=1 Tax=Comamonas sp. GB3 AK4-5 TaxID=3231487 RepID=UPI00351DCFA1
MGQPNAPAPAADAGNSCDQCKATGLSILPVRYAVAPVAIKPALPGWVSGDKVKSVALGSEFHYVLRTLRSGFVYLFYEKNARGSKLWECYVVGADGSLIRQPSPMFAQPQSTPVLQCARHGSNNTQVHYLVIEQPEKCGPTWIAFSQDKWSNATLERYTRDTKARNARMQSIHPAEMAAGSKHSHGNLAEASALEAVLEYAPALDTSKLKDGAPTAALSKEDGSYTKELVPGVCTRYPWHLRKGMAQSTAAHMQGRSQGSKPHVLALWDGVGIAHELNGYRTDAKAWLALYLKERVLESDAVERYDEIQQLIKHRALVVGDQGAERARSELDRIEAESEDYIGQDYDSEVQSIKNEHRTLVTKLKNGDIDFAAYKAERNGVIERNTLDEYKQSSLKTRYAMHDALRALNTPRGREGARAGYKKMSESDWGRLYEPKIYIKKAEAFKKQQQALTQTVEQLQAQRTASVKAWLQAPLFIGALNDYDGSSLEDGLCYEEAVTTALEGLGSEAQGLAALLEIINLPGNVPESLIWRAMALNQSQHCEGMAKTAALAASHKNAQTDAGGAFLKTTATAMDYLKPLSDLYQKSAELAKKKQGATGSEQALKNSGVDRLMSSIGYALLKWTGGNFIADSLAWCVVQSVLMVRAGAAEADVRRLIQQQAKHDPAIRAKVLQRWKALSQSKPGSALILALSEVSESDGSRTMRAEWEKIKAGGSAEDHRFAPRMAVVAGLMEMAKLTIFCAQADKSLKDYSLAVASLMSVVAAYSTVAMEVEKKLFSEAAKTVTYWKAMGAYMSAGGAFVGVVWDANDVVENYDKERYGFLMIFMLKTIIGIGSSIAFSLTALSFSASWLAKQGVRQGSIVFLERVGAGIAAYETQAAAKATGTAVAKGVVQRSAFIGLGRFIAIMAGWEVAAALVAIQLLVWALAPDDLQDWCEQSAYGKKKKFTKLEEQRTAYDKAAKAVGLVPQAPAAA